MLTFVHNIFPHTRPMDFLQCDPPVDFRSNETAKEESGYGCTKVSGYVVVQIFLGLKSFKPV